MGNISKEKLVAFVEKYKKSEYGNYLQKFLNL
jgi:hypothetical protein